MTQETPARDPMHVAAETAMEAVARRLAQHVGAPYGDLVMGPNRAALIAVDEAAPIIRDAARAQALREAYVVLSELLEQYPTIPAKEAAGVEGEFHNWAFDQIAPVRPAVRPVDATADRPEGSGHPRAVAGDPVPLTHAQLRAAGVPSGAVVSADDVNRVRPILTGPPADTDQGFTDVDLAIALGRTVHGSDGLMGYVSMRCYSALDGCDDRACVCVCHGARAILTAPDEPTTPTDPGANRDH